MRTWRFWRALESLLPEWRNKKDESVGHRILADAIRDITLSRWNHAIPSLDGLRQDRERRVRNAAAELAALYRFQQGEWDDFLVRSEGVGGEVGFDRPLAQAFRSAPALSLEWAAESPWIPLGTSSTGVPTVEARIGGISQSFWLDTGSGLTVLCLQDAETLGVRILPGKEASVGTSTRRRIPAHPCVIESLEVGGAIFKNLPAILLDRSCMQLRTSRGVVEIPAILGWNAIRHVDLRLDFRKKQARLSPPEKTVSGVPAIFWMGFPVVRATSEEGIFLFFGLDTGAASTMGGPGLSGKVSFAGAWNRQSNVAGAGTQEVQEYRMLPGFRVLVGGVWLCFRDFPVSGRSPGAVAELDGVLGIDSAMGEWMRISAVEGRFEIAREQP